MPPRKRTTVKPATETKTAVTRTANHDDDTLDRVTPAATAEVPASAAPPRAVKIPTFTERTSLAKRMALFGLILLVLFYAVQGAISVRQNKDAIDAATNGINRVGQQVEEQKDINRQLLSLLRANNIAVSLGPDSDKNGVPDVIQASPNGTPTTTPVPGQTGQRGTNGTNGRNSTGGTNGGTSGGSTGGGGGTQPQPSPRPQPSPSPDHGIITDKPLITCRTLPLGGRVCV